MGEWVGIVVALALGVPLLVTAVILDARRRRRTQAELASAPSRGNEVVDALVPRYVTQDEVDALARPGAGAAPSPAARGGVLLGFGHLDADFATAGDVAELTNAVILMVADDVLSMRELLTALAGATRERPLVVVAASFHPDVVATLRANRRATGMPVVAVEANPAELLQLQDVVGGEVLCSADLKAGWLPAPALGAAASWRSDTDSASVVGAGVGKG